MDYLYFRKYSNYSQVYEVYSNVRFYSDSEMIHVPKRFMEWILKYYIEIWLLQRTILISMIKLRKMFTLLLVGRNLNFHQQRCIEYLV